jgi:radical SAM protein with 4Fe4S-binding SPASM domain
MSDKFGIDGHKLAYHPVEVARLLEAENDVSKLIDIYPIYVEVSPVGACNHRCTFCAVDYIGYQATNRIDVDVMMRTLEDMGSNGVKSIMYAGEGEPLIHKQINEIVAKTKEVGIDVSFTTNAVAMNDRFIENSLQHTSWIKVSLNGGSAKSYAQVHQTREIDFQRVINNLKKAVEFRNKNKLNCTIGVQSVLLPENADEMVNLGKIIRDEIGVDYFVIKPFSQEPSSINRLYEDIDYRSMTLRANEKKLKALENENFKVSYRSETMSNYHEDQENRYTTCYSTPIYMAYLMAEGSVYGCKDHLLDTNFCYGNINKNTFTEIWKGERRREGIEYVLNELDVSKCRVNCRMDKVNRYLFDLKEGKVDHMNFI